MSEHSGYIVYVDESGDHSLQSIDDDYPVFVLAFCVFEIATYVSKVTPAVQNFKFNHFGHDMVVLHENAIRKSKEPFGFLMDKNKRVPFLEQLTSVIAQSEFTIIAAVIRKQLFKDKHAAARNPYDVAMQSGLERISKFLAQQNRTGKTAVVFEARGAKEDGQLELEFRRVCAGENSLRTPLDFEFVIASKQVNSCGLQLADLVARPIGRKQIKPEQENRAYDLLSEKFFKGPKDELEGWGLSTFPST